MILVDARGSRSVVLADRAELVYAAHGSGVRREVGCLDVWRTLNTSSNSGRYLIASLREAEAISCSKPSHCAFSRRTPTRGLPLRKRSIIYRCFGGSILARKNPYSNLSSETVYMTNHHPRYVLVFPTSNTRYFL